MDELHVRGDGIGRHRGERFEYCNLLGADVLPGGGGSPDAIQHGRANYVSIFSGVYPYDTSPTRGYHPTYNDGVMPYTSPVGSFDANGYGLYDMAGNVWEWCWDESGATRCNRGGCWVYNASIMRCGYASWLDPNFSRNDGGFRAVCR